MESALTTSPPSVSARRSARADLPLAVGPAISQTLGPMALFAVTLVGPDAQAVEAAAGRARSLAGEAGEVKSQARLGPAALDLIVEAGERPDMAAAVEGLPVDLCVQPAEGRRKRLFLADMDSTIIGC